jgi:hypothetical protein
VSFINEIINVFKMKLMKSAHKSYMEKINRIADKKCNIPDNLKKTRFEFLIGG